LDSEIGGELRTRRDARPNRSATGRRGQDRYVHHIVAWDVSAMTQDHTTATASMGSRLGAEGGRHWPFLDLIRFSAALLVLLGHARGLLLESFARVEQPNPLLRLFYLVSGLQHEGVVMFFIVSGFLVGGSVWRLIAQARFDVGAYLINRFARIYLVFIPALLLALVLDIAGRQFLADGRFYGVRPLLPANIFAEWWWSQIPCHVAALQGLICLPWGVNPPLWSLGYEWGLYLIAPAIFGALLAAMPRERRFASCAAVVLVFALLTWWNPDWPFWFSLWMLGAIAARVFAARPVGLLFGIAGLVIAAIGLVLSRTALLPPIVTDACLAGGLAVAVACPVVMRWTGSVRAVAHGAAFSYSLYATHLPVCVFVGALLERFAGWPTTLVQPDLRGLLGFTIMVICALVVARGFAFLTEDRTAAVREWLLTLRASLRWEAGRV
jgi:peptidoglycan/LPS O-acetylase OafA/YrhL